MEPRCPYCNAQGVQHIAARPLSTAVVIYCSQCGAIFGVVPNQPEPKRGLLKNPANIAIPGEASAPPKPAMTADEPKKPGRSAIDYNFGRGTRYMIIPDMEEEEPDPISHGEPKPKPYFNPGQPDPLPHRGIEPADEKPLTPEQSQAMMDYYKQFNRGTNRTRIIQDGDE